jgi:threonine/homoserine/homoserine lactone efflux protein
MIAVSVNAVFVLTAGRIAGFLATRPAWARGQRMLMGSVLGALAVRLAVQPAS